MSEPILDTRALAVGYGKTPLLSGVELCAVPGEILTLIGPNGAGKSTILKTITRQLAPLGGLVMLDGRDLNSWQPEACARTLSILTTGRVEAERMTCAEVVSAGRYPYTGRLGTLTRADRKLVEEAMALVRLTELAERPFAQLSDGQRQRVLLARAICQQPRVLVLDEPTSYLDVRYKLELLQILRGLAWQQGVAVVLSLHELDLAQRISDRILCVREGAVDRCGTPEEIFSGGYIRQLYGVEAGSFEECYGSLELQPPTGQAQVFVIGGGGAGIPVYRRLQRAGTPFAAGILQQNDLEMPVAEALAARVIAQPAFEPVGEDTFRQAAALLDACPRVLCCLKAFGPLNEANRRLRDRAARNGSLEKL